MQDDPPEDDGATLFFCKSLLISVKRVSISVKVDVGGG